MFRKAGGGKWIVEGEHRRFPALIALRSLSSGVRRYVFPERVCVVRTTEEQMAERLMEAK